MPHISKDWEVPVGLNASQNSSIINHEIVPSGINCESKLKHN